MGELQRVRYSQNDGQCEAAKSDKRITEMSAAKNKQRKALILAGYMSKIAVVLADSFCRLDMKTIIEQFCETGEQVTFKFCVKPPRLDLASHSLSE